MVNISDSISTISTAATRAIAGDSAPKPCLDSHGIWAELLAMKVRQLKRKEAERFKHDVDAMILDLMPDDSNDD